MVIGDCGVEDDFDGFGVCVVVMVGCVGDVFVVVVYLCGDYIGLVVD